jgi:hypothetical protein
MPTKVTRTSFLTGITRTMEFSAYEPDEFENHWLAYKNGYLTLDEAFDKLSEPARLFVKCGATEAEWRRYIIVGDNVRDRGY